MSMEGKTWWKGESQRHRKVLHETTEMETKRVAKVQADAEVKRVEEKKPPAREMEVQVNVKKVTLVWTRKIMRRKDAEVGLKVQKQETRGGKKDLRNNSRWRMKGGRDNKVQLKQLLNILA